MQSKWEAGGGGRDIDRGRIVCVSNRTVPTREYRVGVHIYAGHRLSRIEDEVFRNLLSKFTAIDEPEIRISIR